MPYTRAEKKQVAVLYASNAAVSGETAARIDGDAILQNNINSETNSRISGDLNLQNQITGETLSRITEDIRLNNLITGETSVRVIGELNLQSQITGETYNRIQSDTVLQNEMSGLTLSGITNYNTLNSLITGETVNRISGDLNLQTQINGLQGGFLGSVTATGTAPQPGKSGIYQFSTSGTTNSSYLSMSGTTVSPGDEVNVKYVSGTTYVYSYINRQYSLSDSITGTSSNIGASQLAVKTLGDNTVNLKIQSLTKSQQDQARKNINVIYRGWLTELSNGKIEITGTTGYTITLGTDVRIFLEGNNQRYAVVSPLSLSLTGTGVTYIYFDSLSNTLQNKLYTDDIPIGYFLIGMYNGIDSNSLINTLLLNAKKYYINGVAYGVGRYTTPAEFDAINTLLLKKEGKTCEITPKSNTFVSFDLLSGSTWTLTVPNDIRIILKDATRINPATTIPTVTLLANVISYVYYNVGTNSLIVTSDCTTVLTDSYLFAIANIFEMPHSIIVNTPIYKVNGYYYGANAKNQNYVERDASDGYVGLTGFKLNLKNSTNTFTSYLTNSNTTGRTYTLQDKDGTLATTSDILLKAKNRAFVFSESTSRCPTITSGSSNFTISIPTDMRIALDGYDYRLANTGTTVTIGNGSIYFIFIRKSTATLETVSAGNGSSAYLAALNDVDLYLFGMMNGTQMPNSIFINSPIYTYNGVIYGSGAAKVDPSTLTSSIAPYSYLLSGRQILNPELPKKASTDLLRILFIGSSWLQDTAALVRDVAKASSLNVRVGNVYKTAMGYQEDVANYNNNVTTGIEYFLFHEDGSSDTHTTGMQNIKSIVTGETWDIIVIQQDAYSSFTWSTYQPYMKQWISLLKRDATNPNVVIAMNHAWTPNFAVNNYGFATIGAMWQATLDNIRMASYQSGIDLVIPCGMAVAALRTTSLNGVSGTALSKLIELTRDSLHLDLGIGRYLTACTVFEAILKQIYGVSVIGNTYRNATSSTATDMIQTPVDNTNAPIIQKCAIAACSNRFDFTDFTNIL